MRNCPHLPIYTGRTQNALPWVSTAARTSYSATGSLGVRPSHLLPRLEILCDATVFCNGQAGFGEFQHLVDGGVCGNFFEDQPLRRDFDHGFL